MNSNTHGRRFSPKRLRHALWLPGFVIILILGGCGGSSSSSSADSADETSVDEVADDSTQQMALPLGTAAKDIQLEAGTPIEVKFTYDIPIATTAQGDFTINVARTLQSASLTAGPAPRSARLGETLLLLAKALIKDAIAAETAQVTGHVSFAGDPDVCSSPIMFGPATVAGAIGMAPTTPTASATPLQPAIDIINTGSIEICVITTPPITAVLNIPSIEVDIEACADPTVEIANSSWIGTYQCENFGTDDDPPGSEISLSITQNEDGSYQYVDDEGTIYDGHLCGNKFKFNGGSPGAYTESGTLIFASADSATKTSRWNGVPSGTEGGKCTDTLTRM